MAVKIVLGGIVALIIAITILAGSLYLGSLYLGDLSNDVVTIEVQDLIISESAYETAPRDPFSSISADIDNDILKVKARYGGGCNEHDFALIASPGFMESNPVQANAVLSHDAHNDSCEALITQDLAFDLSPLKEAWQQAYQQTSGIILIHLEVGEESISLTYQF
ncbi:MAG: hypothetical protein ACFFCZ_27035 [Promethearchaeota archaeon]